MVTSAGLPLELQWSTEKPLSMLSIAGRASLASGPANSIWVHFWAHIIPNIPDG
jgi:hypothetical protein